jgi:hypothetical protein
MIRVSDVAHGRHVIYCTISYKINIDCVTIREETHNGTNLFVSIKPNRLLP